MADSPNLSPMMGQYLRMKQSLPQDVWLFFRLGDFYEMFFEDAQEASSLLGLTLTKRQSIPMCGVPHHAADSYIAQAISLGKRVAIAEQVSTPIPGKLVEREIARVISAGTVTELNQLDASEHQFIVACYSDKKGFGLACADHTTGAFHVADFPDYASLKEEVLRLHPRELVISEEQQDVFSDLPVSLCYDAFPFLPVHALPSLLEHFGVLSLDGFGCAKLSASLGAAAAILHYLRCQLRRSTEHLRSLSLLPTRSAVQMDEASRRNLDLVEARGGRKFSLLGAMDRTVTPMGSRLLRDWLLHPLDDLQALIDRQDAVASFLEEAFLMSKLRESLKDVRDMERLSSRLAQGAGNARDLLGLSVSLSQLPFVTDDLEFFVARCPSLLSLRESLGEFSSLVAMLSQALVCEPPVSVKEGGMIQDGYHADLDALRVASREGKQWLAEMEARERESTGIDSLKIRYNSVFGYYLEVSKAKLSRVPEHYVRKQTLANAERYVTEELKGMESSILGADERSRQLEYEIFCSLRQEVHGYLEAIQRSAAALARLDVLLSFAHLARQQSYVRPLLDEAGDVMIVNGRHPVIEQVQSDVRFVPNDTVVEAETQRVLLLTGPNMAGKSTYIRQVALITLMAQMGSFVPADSARIGLVDRIFCRVGASDDLARGQSTFMVEMSETALILNNATKRSLVILDEIGRGTATFDGLSIAWSVVEHLHDVIGARTLFATHYHELVDLAQSHSAVSNWHVEVREAHDEIVFLRKVLPGPADKSYGIQVARLAGLPVEILERAKEILSRLEEASSAREARTRRAERARKSTKRVKTVPDVVQLDLFDVLEED